MNPIKPASPLPWRKYTDTRHRVCVTPRRIGDPYSIGSDICTIDEPTIGAGPAEHADAAYIVHACNAYPSLVEALQAIFPFLEADIDELASDDPYQRAIEMLRVALAATKEPTR